MKKRVIITIITLIAFSLLISIGAFAAQSVPQSVLDASDSVVRIFAGDYTGTGFVVASDDKNTYVATNYHVIEDDPEGAFIWLSDESNINASVLVADKERDICILKIGFPLGITPVTLSDAGGAKGDAIYAVGFPGAADIISAAYALDSDSSTITDGIVSSVRRGPVTENGPEVDILQVSAAINPGNSGGPVFNEAGSVVGISSLGVDDSQGIFGAIDIDELKNLMDSKSIAYITDTVEESESIPIWVYIVIGVAVLLIVVIAVLVIALLKNKRKNELERTEWTFVGGTATDNENDTESGKSVQSVNWAKIGIISGVAVIVILIGTYVATYSMAKSAAEEFRFSDAYNLLIAKPITKAHDNEFYRYVDAGETMNRENYEAAAIAFEGLGDYKNSDLIAKNCRYQLAKSEMGKGNYTEAADMFKALDNYDDSLNLKYECEYQLACQMIQNGNYEEAIALLDELSKNAGYKDASIMKDQIMCSIAMSEWDGESSIIPIISQLNDLEDEGNQYAAESKEELKKIAYSALIELYHNGYNKQCKELSGSMPGYEDSDKYYTLSKSKLALEDINVSKIQKSNKDKTILGREALDAKYGVKGQAETEATKVINIARDISEIIPFEDSQDIYDYCWSLVTY